MIKTQSLTKYYGKTRGIENLDLTIKKGEIFGLLGPNGAGKTTTLRMLMGMIKPTAGSATVSGFDCWKQSVQINKISGYIPGDARLYQNETGQSLINTFGKVRKNKKLASSLIERFEYDPSKKIKTLSKGNRQKLSIILALMHEPKILILDEPTSGLDPLMQHKFYDLIKEMRSNGTTILMSSHFLPEIEGVCERVGIVKDGSLIAVDEVSDLAAKHVKQLNIRFKKAPDLKNFGLTQITEIIDNGKNSYRMKVKGDINPVIKALSNEELIDMSLEPVTLEEIFLEYYE